MHRVSDSSTRELARTQLRLANDLKFTPQQYDDRVFYHIEQPSRSKFFKIGWPEYVFLSLMDGETTLAEAVSRSAGVLGAEALNEQEAQTICHWLIENELAHAADGPQSTAQKSHSKPGGFSRLNPFWMKFPLCRPDRILDALNPWWGWLHSLPVLILAICFWIGTAIAVGCRWDEFSQTSQGVLAPENWLWLGLAWMGLKLVHEFSHAAVCKRYGGEVSEMGVIVMLFAPMAYVDVTSSWAFRSRWKRMHVAAAGMIAEFQIASMCGVWWLHTDSPQTAHILFTVIFMASLTTVLFNANPLMKFDGYYLLSDAVNIPNLATNGSQFLKGVTSRWFFGTPSREVGWRGWKGLFVRLYGILAFAWRIVVCTGMIITASLLFHGAGLVLAAFAVLSWLCLPVLKAIATWSQQIIRKPTLAMRAIGTLSVAVGMGYLVWSVIPWPGVRQAHGIVEYAPLSVVRAEVAGFVETVHVKDGQTVAAGNLLFTIRNDDLLTECRDLELQIEQSHIKRRKHQNEGEIAAAQVEQSNRESLEKQLAELEKRKQRLVVRAPVSGRVMARELPLLKESFVKEGTQVLEIGQPDKKELQIAISQPDIQIYRHHLDEAMTIRLRNGMTLAGTLEKLAPRATQHAPQEALYAPAGGPLAVTPPDPNSEDDAYELVQPHLEGRVALTGPPQHLEAGLLGAISLREESDSLGRVAYRRLIGWLRDQETLFETQTR